MKYRKMYTIFEIKCILFYNMDEIVVKKITDKNSMSVIFYDDFSPKFLLL